MRSKLVPRPVPPGPCGYRASGSDGKKAGEDLKYEVFERVDDCTGYRLPTEAEWERAARGGTSTALYTGNLTIRGKNDGPELDPIAWYGGNSGVSYSGGHDCSGWDERQYPESKTCGTHPVAKKKPNPWGLHDVLGNVGEWTWDWNGRYGGESVDPHGPARGTNRVYRGGSWSFNARYVRAASRYPLHPWFRWEYLGFRLARGQEAEPGKP